MRRWKGLSRLSNMRENGHFLVKTARFWAKKGAKNGVLDYWLVTMAKLHPVHLLEVRRTRGSKKRSKYMGGVGSVNFFGGFCDRIGVEEAFHTTILRFGRVIFRKARAVRPTARGWAMCRITNHNGGGARAKTDYQALCSPRRLNARHLGHPHPDSVVAPAGSGTWGTRLHAGVKLAWLPWTHALVIPVELKESSAEEPGPVGAVPEGA